jgi:hypothetical protein
MPALALCRGTPFLLLFSLLLTGLQRGMSCTTQPSWNGTDPSCTCAPTVGSLWAWFYGHKRGTNLFFSVVEQLEIRAIIAHRRRGWDQVLRGESRLTGRCSAAELFIAFV